jgi:anti-repressor protein
MNDLIPVTTRQFNGKTIQAVNARELHNFLQVGKMFTHWINDRIEKYGFTENHDFEVFADSGKNPSGGRPAKEYAITLDMAKELAMVERNERGRQARRYFIECERRLKNPGAALTRMDLIKMALDSEEQRLVLQSTVEEMTPKALFHDQCAVKPGSISLAEAAKIIGTGRNRFSAFLRQKHWLTRKNEPYQERIESGDLDVKLGSWEHPTEGLQRCVTALVTGKGLTKLQRLWKEHTEELVT